MTVDGAAKKATLKTADGVFPVAVEAPEAGRRLRRGQAWLPIFSYTIPADLAAIECSGC